MVYNSFPNQLVKDRSQLYLAISTDDKLVEIISQSLDVYFLSLSVPPDQVQDVAFAQCELQTVDASEEGLPLDKALVFQILVSQQRPERLELAMLDHVSNALQHVSTVLIEPLASSSLLWSHICSLVLLDELKVRVLSLVVWLQQVTQHFSDFALSGSFAL